MIALIEESCLCCLYVVDTKSLAERVFLGETLKAIAAVWQEMPEHYVLIAANVIICSTHAGWSQV